MVKVIASASAQPCSNLASASGSCSATASSGEDGRVFCLRCSHGQSITDQARAIYEFPFPVKLVVAEVIHEADGEDEDLPLTAVRASYGIGSEPDFAERAAAAVAQLNGGLLADLGEAYFRLDVFSGVTLRFNNSELRNFSAEVFAPGGASTPEAQNLLTHMSNAAQISRCPRALVEVARRLLDIGFVVQYAAIGDIAGRVVLCHAVGSAFNPRNPTGISVEIAYEI
jgi:hypothetical protein